MSEERGKVYGHIPGYPVGTTFKSRKAVVEAALHCLTQAGIHGDSSEDGGAFSICLSGGYEDNDDRGERITYVGSGGQSKAGVQEENQSFDDPANRSLWVSCQTKRPVRVIRGKSKYSNWSPNSGYRYDGLYVVDLAEMRPGKKGFNMCFFELRRLNEEGQPKIPYLNRTKQRITDNMRKIRTR